MRVTLQYFDGCPNWQTAHADLDALAAEGLDFQLELELVDTVERAEDIGFRGSPTLLVDGIDHFADPEAPVGLSCRVYRTDRGFAGSPSRNQLRAHLSGGS